MTEDRMNKPREFAARYTAAWCSQDAARVAACEGGVRVVATIDMNPAPAIGALAMFLLFAFSLPLVGLVFLALPIGVMGHELWRMERSLKRVLGPKPSDEESEEHRLHSVKSV